MRFRCIWMTVAFVLVLSTAWADEQRSNNVLDKRVTIYGGVQVYDADGEFRSSRDGRPDVDVDMDDLNLDQSPITPIFGAIFNFGKRFNLRLDYFGYHDDAETTAEFNIDFDDAVIPLGARVKSSFDLDLYVANLGYNFYRSERARIGAGLGLHLADLDLDIRGKFIANGEEIKTQRGSADFLAPLPNLYAYGAYGFTDRLILRYGGGWMSMDYGDYDGELYFANAFFEYWPYKYAGFGAGYRYLEADVEYDPGHKQEDYEFTLPGPLIYMTLGF